MFRTVSCLLICLPGPLLQLESPNMCAKLCTVAASNNRDHTPQSLYCCLFAPHICGVVLRAHTVRGESHIQRNANGEVATLSNDNNQPNTTSYALLCHDGFNILTNIDLIALIHSDMKPCLCTEL